jgi:SprT protein
LTRNNLHLSLQKHIPADAVDHCIELWDEFPFKFNIKAKRATKLGDYRYDPKNKSHTISINNDLNTYSFLITYLHEVAHLITFHEYGRKVKPHGIEWKAIFKKISLPILNTQVFPDEILRKLANYLKNAKASSCNDHNLMRALKIYDNNESIFLSDISVGEIFNFGSRAFKKESLRRTRFVCQEVSSGRKYLISKSAVVTKY